MLSYQKLSAQVLEASACVGGLLYVSPFCGAGAQAVRGDIPVLLPQFADRGPLKKHDFARDLPWQLVEQGAYSDGYRLVYELHIHPERRYVRAQSQRVAQRLGAWLSA